MYIYATFNHEEILTDKATDKRPFLTKRFNRADNFVNLALYGAQNCVSENILPTNSSIYISSTKGNMNATLKVMQDIHWEDQLPRPFHFLNSVNAVNLFYVAKSFNLKGKTLFVDTFESALPQAFIDVSKNKTALLGVVTEIIEDLSLHTIMFENVPIEESSRWMLLANDNEKKKAIAKITDIRFESTPQKHAIKNLFSFLESNDKEDVFYFNGDNLSFQVEKIKHI
ncbi:MAG: hypothetical protein L3J43_07285 [Sulfurovum sp.]|nr:hypothetical protein [Sulfurovum sp.]